jgi:hypothetical protein
VDDVDRARAEEVPIVVLTGLFPKSLKRAADCLVYRDRLVFVGLSRKAVAKRGLGGGIVPLELLPLALFGGAGGIWSATNDAARLADVPPELAEAATHARTILFGDIVAARFAYAYGRPYSVKLELRDGTKETLLPATVHTKKADLKRILQQVLPVPI